MVNIPEQKDPTLEAMYFEIEGLQEKKRRDYIGASAIGNPCARQIWYEYNGYERKPFNAKTLMNFEDGHYSEDLTAARLRLIQGIELHTHNEDGSQFGFKAMDGKFGGHCDGFIRGLLQAPKAWHVWEHKACGQKKYNEFISKKEKHGEKNVLQKWNETYYVQAQLYMHYSKLDRHYLTVALAGSREYQSCRTEYKPEIAEQYIDRAEKILNATEPPRRKSEKSDFYLCKWCDFKDICHG